MRRFRAPQTCIRLMGPLQRIQKPLGTPEHTITMFSQIRPRLRNPFQPVLARKSDHGFHIHLFLRSSQHGHSLFPMVAQHPRVGLMLHYHPTRDMAVRQKWMWMRMGGDEDECLLIGIVTGIENGAVTVIVIVSEGGIYPRVKDREDLERGIVIVTENVIESGTVFPGEVEVVGVTGGVPGQVQVQMGLVTEDWWKGWDYRSRSQGGGVHVKGFGVVPTESSLYWVRGLSGNQQ